MLDVIHNRPGETSWVTSETGEMDKSLLESMFREHWRAQQAEDSDVAARSSKTRELSSQDLFGGNREVIIRHGIDAYRLQITGSGKLLLTK